MGALNVDYIASASRLSQLMAEQVQESVARFEWNTEGPVDQASVTKAIERLGGASLDASLGGSAWLTIFTLAQLRLDVRLGYIGVVGRIETPGLSFLGQMDRLGIDRTMVTRRPDLLCGVCLSYLDDVERVLLTHPGANFAMADHLRSRADAIAAYLSAARIVHVTSFLDEETPPLLLDVLRDAKERNPALLVSFDPGFDWAKHPTRAIEGILALSDLIFVNHREFKALADYTVGESDEVLAARLVERIVPTATVFVTKRYDAVDVFRASATGVQARRFQLRRPLREISVEDATGAGDVFSASVLAARVSRPLQVELGARLGLGVVRRRTGREAAASAPAEASLVQAPEDLTGPGSRPSAVLVAHEGESGWTKLDRFLTEDLDLPVRGIDLSAPSAAEPGKTRPRRRGPVTEAQLASCGFAVCVLGATRTMAGGSRRAGETVVHQVGIFQGFYGFGRVAILAEEGCEAPSNIAGLIRLDFPSGRIESVFWELERMLEREGFLHGRRPGEQ
ncbi:MULTISPECIES: PfkB family carbohydrate kinase [unclassified Streptomyces]|uniref:PfkB family carbohydrate kinase n=1 Tax=unclassified Streptomyces TaxID=2593676 RepID=UPI00224DBE21|nr:MULTISPECIES: PfkB family carbohydrate kinase [unclassified Streptomyces]WSU20562.1 PfkB family carbohydrate kinase [Streptomyces sp. NBC_01108]MCX4790649.1 PfkB family carbohydrate kinase [Streptomyces sp. NBC_01221]MCX4793621.1 PfkB family carbohydrate kinase [Streptomyces sp. NBC_01242]WSJ35049.1 PfkB family carbohydrate kinase [Streptomyces sp. NBC_01321]WSP61489.1 PfkB family carbohydrate kinase [Streptomyces sp. NBC_01240]